MPTHMRHVLVLCLSVVLASFVSGCSAGAHSTASQPSLPISSTAASSADAVSQPVYLAQVTCWNTMSCCIQRFPLTAAQSCGASPAEIAEVLRGAKSLYEATHPEGIRVKEDAQDQKDDKDADAIDAEGVAAPEPPDCQGQNHHVISRLIARALEKHKTLGGLYEPRDKRFVAKAKDKESHCGYQKWHREVDLEVIRWLDRYKEATQKEFEAFLRELYNREDLLKRFPNGFGPAT
jgi:hypothetical protein